MKKLNQEEKQVKGSFYYPVESELRLIYLVKSGEVAEVEKLLTELYQENFINRSIPSGMIRFFFASLQATILRVLGNTDYLDNTLQDIAGRAISAAEIEETPVETFASIKQCCLEMGEIFNKHKNEHCRVLIGKIADYMKDHYMNPNFGLVEAAWHFGLNETYVSRLFKEHMQENFSSYLEKLRLHTARNLLSCTNKPVDEIAALVGYNSATVFRRAFKRYIGISPVCYRDSRSK